MPVEMAEAVTIDAEGNILSDANQNLGKIDFPDGAKGTFARAMVVGRFISEREEYARATTRFERAIANIAPPDRLSALIDEFIG